MPGRGGGGGSESLSLQVRVSSQAEEGTINGPVLGEGCYLDNNGPSAESAKSHP